MSVDATETDEAAGERRDLRSPAALLHTHTNRLLDASLAPIERLNAANGLGDLFAELAGGYALKPERTDVEPATALASGTAISPSGAARCVRDFMRTARFLAGVFEAVAAARRRFARRPIHVLYAGCGPFATLAVPVAGRLGPAEVTFTLIDAHRSALDAARRVFDSLGLSDCVVDAVEGDAAAYEHGGPQIDVVVTETMGVALMGEPQVAVTRRLAPLLPPEGIFVPRRVTLSAALMDLAREQRTVLATDPSDQEAVAANLRAARVPLGQIFELAASDCQTIGSDPFPACVVRIPAIDHPEPIAILTDVEVFPGIVLGEAESELTVPLTLTDLGALNEGESLEFAYALGPKPGLRYRRV